MALAALGQLCGQIGIIGPENVRWASKAGRQLRDVGYELTNAVRKTPFVVNPTQPGSMEPREDAITMVKLLCQDSLPIPPERYVDTHSYVPRNYS